MVRIRRRRGVDGLALLGVLGIAVAGCAGAGGPGGPAVDPGAAASSGSYDCMGTPIPVAALTDPRPATELDEDGRSAPAPLPVVHRVPAPPR